MSEPTPIFNRTTVPMPPISEQKPPKKPLSRSTIEAYIGIIGGLGYSALTALGIPLNFWLGLVLWIGVVFCLVDLTWNSPVTIQWSKSIKVSLTAGIGIFTVVLLMRGWTNTHLSPPSSASTESRIENWDSQELSSRYSLGYVIFDLSANNQIVFYKRRSQLENYAFYWDKVKFVSNSPTLFDIQMPDIRQTLSGGGHFSIEGSRVGGPKKPEWGMTYYTGANVAVVLQVLDADEQSVTFIIGLMPKP